MTPDAREAGSARALTDDDVDAIVERVIDRLTDRHTVERITDAWSGAMDRAIGRGIRRLAGAVILTVVLIGAVKFELLGKVFGR